MSRLSFRAYLAAAKRYLQTSLREKSHTRFVIGNESADLDSIASALVYGYVLSNKPEARNAGKYVVPVTNVASSELALRPELTALLKHADVKPSELITLDDIEGNFPSAESTEWTLVDHNALQGKLGELYRSRVSGVIDHHDDESVAPRDANPRIIQKTGSCASHVVNYLRDTWQQISDSASTVGAAHPQDNERLIDDFAYTSTWDGQVAKLALGAILIDTVNLKAEHKVTEHDKKAVRFLEAKINISRKLGKDYDRDTFFNEINDAKSNLDALSLEDILRKDYKQWTQGNLTLGISSSVKNVAYLTSKEREFENALQVFAKQRKLDLFAIMTAFNDMDFQREILLVTFGNEGKAAAQAFVKNASDELKLEDDKKSPVSDVPEATFVQFWNQKNLDASRKRVAPLMREAMSS